MKRKLLPTWLLTLAALISFSVPSWAQGTEEEVITKFAFSYQGETFDAFSDDYPYIAPTIAIYKDGVQVTTVGTREYNNYYDEVEEQWKYGYVYDYSTNELQKDVTYTYVSSNTNHRGTVKGGESLTLDLRKLTVQAVDEDGNPAELRRPIYIYASNSKITGLYFDYDSYVEGNRVFPHTLSCYLAPGDSYTYETGSSYYYDGVSSSDYRGAIDLTNDATVTIVVKKAEEQPVLTGYTLTVTPRYGDIPLSKEFALYYYGQTNSYISYNSSGTFRATNLVAGSYWVQDRQTGAFSGEIKVTEDTQFMLDYTKVTFTSKNVQPNMFSTITVRAKRQSYSGNYDYYDSYQVTTDGKGHAVFYLLPGEYTYSTSEGITGDFTVGTTDSEVTVQTHTVKFKFNVSDNSNWIAQSVTLNGTPLDIAEDGTAQLELGAGDHQLLFNNIAPYDFTVSGNQTVTVPLYCLQFVIDTPNGTVNVNNINGNGRSCNYNTKYYLPAGTYSYYPRYGFNSDTRQVTLNGDMDIDLNAITLMVKVKDTAGKVVPDMYVYLYAEGSSSYLDYRQTDANGEVQFQCLSGDYAVRAMIEQKSVTLSSAQTVELVVPKEISFKVEGLDFENHSPYLYLYPADDYSYNQETRVFVNEDGAVAARLSPNTTYRISGWEGTTTITEGMTLRLGTISVTTNGVGIAFPMVNFGAISTYNVIVGTVVRLAAVPVGNEQFTSWTINGHEYSKPMIDFTTSAMGTTATANFTGSIVATKIQSKKGVSDLTFTLEDNYVRFTESVEGEVRFYSLDGRVVKEIGVVGDRVSISDLPRGTYLMALTANGNTQTAQFVKP